MAPVFASSPLNIGITVGFWTTLALPSYSDPQGLPITLSAA